MKKVVMIGAGFAGLHIFSKIRYLIGSKIELTIIDAREYSLLKPSLPEVAFDGAPISHSLVELEHTITGKGAEFVHDTVVNVDAKANTISLKSGKTLKYDYLILAPGAVKNYDAIEGFNEFGYSVCDDTQAQKLWKKVQTFEGGKVVVGSAKSVQGSLVDAPKLKAPCEGPIGEIMFMLGYYLREEKHLKQVKDFKIDVFTPGAVFFEDVGPKPHEVVGRFMKEQAIDLHINKVITKIGKDFVSFEDGTQMPSDLTIVIPPYTAPKFLLDSGLGDEFGFIPTDITMRHLDYLNIFAAGDSTSLSQPKLGHIAIIQGGIAAASLLKELGEDIVIPPHKLSIFCIMNMGGYEATLIESDYLYGNTTDIALHSPMARMMKWGFDSYLHFSRGNMPPEFAMNMTEKLIKLLG